MTNNKLAENCIKQAQYDLETAKSNAKDGHHALACFLSYESAVKIVSGFLYKKGAEFVWGSSISDLCEDAMVFDPSFDLVKSIAMLLDKYSHQTRFPTSLPGNTPYEVYDKNDSARSIEISEEVMITIINRI